MFRIPYFLLSLVCVLSLPVNAQDTGQGRLLTLEEAVRLAVEQNYAIRFAENEAQIAANDYSIGNAGFLPSVNFSASQSQRSIGGFSGSPGLSGTSNSAFDLSMNVSTTLFDGFGQFTAYERLGSEKQQVELIAERTKEAALADVVVSYYDLVRQQEQIEVLNEAVEISRERLRIAELRRDLGNASELEVRRAQVDLNADLAALLRQEIAFTAARANFNQLLGREGSLDFRVADTLHIDRSLDMDALRGLAPQMNRELRVARQARETAYLSRKEVRSEWLPTISLQAGYAFTDLTRELGLAGTRPPGFNYGLTATWGVFEGFNRRRRLENATLRLRNSELMIEETRTFLDTRLENAFQAFENSLRLVDLERENVNLAAFNVEVALEQFRVGSITSVELREVQSALTGAEGRFITAQFEAKRAETELLELSGLLLEHLGVRE